jgi:hypothetical protein
MTKDEFIKQVEQLPAEKREQIAKHLVIAQSHINAIYCELHNTPLEFNPLMNHIGLENDLWNCVYRLQRIFEIGAQIEQKYPLS